MACTIRDARSRARGRAAALCNTQVRKGRLAAQLRRAQCAPLGAVTNAAAAAARLHRVPDAEHLVRVG
eukprot:scaffold113672_cov68-Phaeocystis_antarctica.AAC.1